ncbi:hypothetical protein CROQUDRAFT_666143 [Cronartium quercuum f. sp. fusiforme G11]|uniref:Deacetylase sirtuin-type domain-containing protein n=1 Tax=Cronartium quercuum f. sp. fusiforme G11 TaxID=708437 RepID=A0A9P6N9G4_9BASI|nr:hypothetical protein CROQUDRAFT_666143 [Cronartium quercuum f. sp. fusiforme G11]
MGRISMPQLANLSAHERVAPTITNLTKATDKLHWFFSQVAGPNCVAITGAGISVDSGIRAYRGENGSYSINKNHRPIFYHEFEKSETFRKRYWARSYLGYPTVRIAEPNIGHYALATLMKMGYVKQIITQNVDRLHHRALDDPEPFLGYHHILELHGTLRHVHCLDCGELLDRNLIQEELSNFNPDWADYSDTLAILGQEIKTNPDGDVDLIDKLYESFRLPTCPNCLCGTLKPSVIFFGEGLNKETKSKSEEIINQASSLIVIGSSLTTYSAFRLLKLFKDRSINLPLGLVNLGRCRGDSNVDWKLEVGISDLLRETNIKLLSNC